MTRSVRSLSMMLVFVCGVALASTPAHVALVDDEDRRTLAEFAREHGLSEAEVERRYAAAGTIRCPWGSGTGSLVIKNDLVATAAHVFFNNRGSPLGNLTSCKFRTTLSGRQDSRSFSQAFDIGEPSGTDHRYASTDWIVIRLNSGVPGLTPFSLPAHGDPAMPTDRLINLDVTLLAAGHDNWTGHDLNEKSVSRCTIRALVRPHAHDVRSTRSACDTGHKASGGAYLRDDGPESLTLIAIHNGNSNNTDNDARQTFDVRRHFSRGTMVEGDFRQAILNMAALMSVGEVQQSLTDLGYDPGPVDGKMGRSTRTAIRKFQQDRGLPLSVKVNLQLSKALTKALQAPRDEQ